MADATATGSTAGPPGGGASTRNWVVPAIIGSSLLMHTLNATVVFNALPTMAEALNEDLLHMNLVITMFMLASTVFMPVSSWVADRFGAKRVFIIAVILFAVSSGVCALAQNLTQMVVARIFQGMAGAMMIPVGRLVLLRTTPKNELVAAMSVLTMPAMFGPVIGPLIGGALVTFADWRWIFLMNLPIALVGVYLVQTYVPKVEVHEPTPMDWPGFLLSGVGLAALVYGVESVGRSLGDPAMVVVLFTVAAVCLGLYWVHARNRTNAIIDLTLFQYRSFRASVIGGAFLRVGLGAVPFLLAMLLQVCFGMSAFTAGLMTFVSAAGGLVMKTAAPPILRRFGFRDVLLWNGVIVGVSFVLHAFFLPTTPHWVIMAVLGVGGFFRSLQFTSLNGLTYADMEQHQMSRASATASMSQQLMQSIGIGVAATLLHVIMLARGEAQLTTATVAPTFVAIGLLSVVSLFWFARLPEDTGDEMNGRGR